MGYNGKIFKVAYTPTHNVWLVAFSGGERLAGYPPAQLVFAPKESSISNNAIKYGACYLA
jgi:hypothetical protein